MRRISRRDFLKLGGLGLLGLSLPKPESFSLLSSPLDAFLIRQDGAWTVPHARPSEDNSPIQQGRVTARLIWVFDQPSFNAHRVKLHWRDSIVSITGVSISQDAGDYNRVWYELGDEGYAYSGTIQPVQTILNTPVTQVPAAGALAQVTVPYTDAHEQPHVDSLAVYRMYYDTIHWVLSAPVSSFDGKVWYQVLDDKWHKLYYAPGEHLRFIPDEELAPLSPDVPDTLKRIQVRLDDQLVLAYENNQPVFATRAATGAIFIGGTYTTPIGHFMTYHKRPTRHMANGDITASGYDLPGVPWVMYFTEAGLSLHGTYWHNDFGHPKSHGCINLSVEAAKWLFRWTNPLVKSGEQYEYQPSGTTLEIVK
jgi:lipoprotein-anchoring transpeptidase ErfK/SrfK